MQDPNASLNEIDQWILASGRQRVCVVSPHLDDAVYSAFGAIAGNSSIHREVVTVVTEPGPDGDSSWARSAGFESREEEFIARRAEDRRALGNLGVQFRHLGARERDYDGMRRALTDTFGRSDPNTASTLFLIPAGAGTTRAPGSLRRLACRVARRPAGSAEHPEHVVVRDAMIEVLRGKTDSRYAFYAEQPYIWNDSVGRIRKALMAITSRPVTTLACATDTDRKCACALEYSSQAAIILGSSSRYQKRTLARDEEYFLIE